MSLYIEERIFQVHVFPNNMGMGNRVVCKNPFIQDFNEGILISTNQRLCNLHNLTLRGELNI